MFERILSWITVEPVPSLLAITSAVVLLGRAVVRGTDTGFWPWLQRIVEAAVGAVLLLGLLWAFRAILDNNIDTFHLTHDMISGKEWGKVGATWGSPHTQRELIVEHFIETQVQEEIRGKDSAAPVLYRNVKKRQLVPQNSIVGFRGDVDVALSEPEKRKEGYPLYNTYIANARYEYDVVNDSSQETQAEFKFPLDQGKHLHENFSVTVDGQDISSRLRVVSSTISWKGTMLPQQQSKVVVAYTAKGMDRFDYQVPAQREIRNFVLTMTVNSWAFYTMAEPEGGQMTPESKWMDNPKGAILSWKLDRTIMTPKMGIAFFLPERPYAPYGRISQTLRASSAAWTLLGAMVVLTLLIRGEPVRLLDLALLAGAYCAQFLVLAAASDGLGFEKALILGALFAQVFIFLLLRHYAWLSRILMHVLTAFFAVAYPWVSLWPDPNRRNAFYGIVQVGLIVYLFGLALYTRLRANPIREPVLASDT